MYYVKSLFDRFLLMKDGEITKDLSREEVIYLERAFWDENGLRILRAVDLRVRKGAFGAGGAENPAHGPTGVATGWQAHRHDLVVFQLGR